MIKDKVMNACRELDIILTFNKETYSNFKEVRETYSVAKAAETNERLMADFRVSMDYKLHNLKLTVDEIGKELDAPKFDPTIPGLAIAVGVMKNDAVDHEVFVSVIDNYRDNNQVLSYFLSECSNDEKKRTVKAAIYPAANLKPFYVELDKLEMLNGRYNGEFFEPAPVVSFSRTVIQMLQALNKAKKLGADEWFNLEAIQNAHFENIAFLAGTNPYEAE